MKHIGSLTIGALSPASGAESPTGPQHGGIGSERLPATASDKLMESRPRDTDAALEASLPSHVISSLGRVVERYMTTCGEYIVDTRPGALAPCADSDAARMALTAYERACLPAPEQRLYAELASLRVLTKAGQASDEDIRLQIQVYARRLAEYPGDVALHVLRTQPDMEKWWPAWAELKDRLDLHSRKRLEKREMLRELVQITDRKTLEA